MEIERAETSLRAARLCLERHFLDSAAARAYFAMFQAAIYALESQGVHRTEWSHKALHAALADVLIRRRKVLPAVLAGALPSAMEVRHSADYRQPGPGQRQVERMVTMAEHFITSIKEVLRNAQTNPG
jgi:uncharacterized protein (UPF0332 family)